MDAGVMLIVRAAPLPPREMFAFGTRVVFEDEVVTVNKATEVSTSPTLKVILPVAVSSLTVLSVILLMVGRSLTEVTVNRKVSLVVPVPSLTVTVMVVVPFLLEAGVMLIVRFAALPPRLMFAFGTRVVFVDVAVTVNEAAVVSTSPTVKEILPVAVSSFVVLLVISLMVGGSLTSVMVTFTMIVSVKLPSETRTTKLSVPL